MIDNDLLDFYNKIIDDDLEKRILVMLEEGEDFEEILKKLLFYKEVD